MHTSLVHFVAIWLVVILCLDTSSLQGLSRTEFPAVTLTELAYQPYQHSFLPIDDTKIHCSQQTLDDCVCTYSSNKTTDGISLHLNASTAASFCHGSFAAVSLNPDTFQALRIVNIALTAIASISSLVVDLVLFKYDRPEAGLPEGYTTLILRPPSKLLSSFCFRFFYALVLALQAVALGSGVALVLHLGTWVLITRVLLLCLWLYLTIYNALDYREIVNQ